MSGNDKPPYKRISIRLKGYDYSQAGAYFVTIVTHQRKCIFGEIVNGEMHLNQAGKIAYWEWQNLAQRFRFGELSIIVIMPNHIHAIVIIYEDARATRQRIAVSAFSNDTPQNMVTVHPNGPHLPRGPKPMSLGALVGQFKSRVTKRLWRDPQFNSQPIWQRNYYEHIIRDEQEMQKIWDYIESNPAQWEKDAENPLKIR